jgi:hypothetical protein
VSSHTVCPDLFTARKKILFCIDLEFGQCWRWLGYFGEGIILLLLTRFELRSPPYILVIVLKMLPGIDLTILIRRDGGFGFGVFDS